MCGFSGIISKNKLPNIDFLNKSKKFIQNRGPDAFEAIQYKKNKNNFYFNHARLSIIDLKESSNQPFEKDGYTLVFNGEIYNYKEIREKLIKRGADFLTNSDTEVILESYKAWGIECLQQFIGMFAFALHDIEKNKIILIRDRAGVKPLYYYLDEETIVFSSDQYALKYLSRKQFDLNLNSVNRFFQIGYCDNNNTYFHNVNKVESGSYISVELDNFKYTKNIYWNPLNFFNQKNEQSENEIIDSLDDILTSSFNYRMVSDVPVGVFLSGGYDSSVVSAILKKKLNYDLTCFTIGFENSQYDESKYAKEVANHLGVNHKSYTCTYDDTKSLITKLVDVYDEPFGDSSAIPTLLVSKYASNDVKVVLSADGGDEVFAGYDKYTTAIEFYKNSKLLPNFIKKNITKIPNNFLMSVGNLFSGRNVHVNHIEKLKNLLNKKSLLDISNGLGENPNSQIFNSEFNKHIVDFDIGELNNLLLYDYKNYMESDILKKVDRATMYYSIEGREPLIDHRIFEFMAGIDESLKIYKNNKKYLLKKITHKYIPKQIMDRPKMGFGIPINKMIHDDKELFQLFFDTISDSEIKKLEFLNFNELTKCKNQYKKNHEHNYITLWYLFNFINWNNKIQTI